MSGVMLTTSPIECQLVYSNVGITLHTHHTLIVFFFYSTKGTDVSARGTVMCMKTKQTNMMGILQYVIVCFLHSLNMYFENDQLPVIS